MVSIQAFFKKNFLTGLLVSVPVLVTVFAVVWFFEFIDGILAPLYDRALGYHVAGLGFISAVILIFIVGMVSTNVIGKRLIWLFERLLLRIPFMKGIYTALKQIVDAFSPDRAGSFRRFVIVEHPREGSYAFGFLTKECIVDKGGDGLSLQIVYIPTNNLYLGEIVLLKREDILYTDIPIEEGIKIILSGGIATPEKIKWINR